MFNQPSTFVDEVDSRLFERVEVREAGRSIRSTQRPASSGDWDWDSGDPSWEEPSIQVESKTIFKKEVSKKKPKPGSFLRDV